MAENEEVKTRKVYTFDMKKASRPLIHVDELPENQGLQVNQTTVEPKDDNNYWNGSAWVSELVVVYEFDPTQNNLFTGINMIPQGAVLAANQTFVKPADGLYQPMRFNGTTWIGTPKEEWEKANPAPEQKPSSDAQAMNALGLQVASLIKENQQMKQSINALGLAFAKSSTTTNGGNQ